MDLNRCEERSERHVQEATVEPVCSHNKLERGTEM